jgi:hypothetical protein
VALKRQNDEYLNHIALALTIKLLLIKIFPKYLVQQKKKTNRVVDNLSQ